MLSVQGLSCPEPGHHPAPECCGILLSGPHCAALRCRLFGQRVLEESRRKEALRKGVWVDGSPRQQGPGAYTGTEPNRLAPVMSRIRPGQIVPGELDKLPRQRTL